ncbi:MAG: hypothetical protein P1P84_08415 [Deferrisomatales bacterium]|nr:hypothetical protein [Deferrisomatales bacterium]
MDYFILYCFGPIDADRATVDLKSDLEDVYWNSGDIISTHLPDTFHLQLDVEQGEALVPMFNPGILVMHDDMISTLRIAGVDNFQTFSAVISDEVRNVIHTNYKVVNIIGKVACANLSMSQHTAHGEPIMDVDFDSLVIDESRTHGLLMFRLAECVSAIVIADSVREALQEAGIKHLNYVSPEDFVG